MILFPKKKNTSVILFLFQVRLAPSRATITDTGGSCDGPDVDRKSCDAGPCCGWDSWSEWSPCIGCGATAMIKRSRQCSAEGPTGRGMPPLSFQEDSMPRQTYIGPPDLTGLSPIVPIIHRGLGKRHAGFQLDGREPLQ